MKSYTDLDQSKELAEILPLESADGYWDFQIDGYNLIADKLGYYKNDSEIPCWSLAALLEILKDYQLFSNGLIVYIDNDSYRIDSDNPVDSCYEMILRLNEQKLL